MHKLLASVLLGFSCILAPAAEAPVLLGSAEIPALMQLTENLGKLADKFSPGSSVKLVLGVTAISFSPQFIDFDTAAPIRAFLYGRNGTGGKPLLEWCLVLKKKKEQAPPLVVMSDNMEMHVKDSGPYAILSSSKTLLASIKELPTPSEPSADIVLSIRPEACLPFCKDELGAARSFLTEAFMRSENPEDANIPAAKALQIKLSYAEKILPQISRLDTEIFFQDQDVKIRMKFDPAKNSELGKFIIAQAGLKPASLSLCGGKLSSGFLNLSLSPVVKESLSTMVRELMLELSEDEKDLRATNLLAGLCKDFDGRASYFSDLRNDLPVTVFSIDMPRELADKFTKQLGPASGESGLCLISSNSGPRGKKLKLFCKSIPSGLVLLYGALEAEEAAKLLSTAPVPVELPKDVSPSSNIVGIFSIPPKKGKDAASAEPGGFFAAHCKDGSAIFDFNFKIDALKEAVPASASEPSNHKKKSRLK
ncbi:MAG: hypothetical protein A2X49_04655 [Lentisphaerae bacterium GWF2_52_8]|nr:MAG: hypothetical protein A2X49_04655 [Lentisphaerae bacterium GWF2_52_8]